MTKSYNAQPPNKQRIYLGRAAWFKHVATYHKSGLNPRERDLFSQYCSLTRKKDRNGELMASHSDDLYRSFSKMTQYCTDEISGMHERGTQDKYWRLWYWRPILVLQNELMVLDENDKHDCSLRNVKKASLDFKFHDEEYQRSICIDIVVEDSLLECMTKIIQEDESVKAKLSEHRYGRI